MADSSSNPPQQPTADELLLVDVAGLFKRNRASGEPFLAGLLGGAVVYVFANSQKAKDSDPDYILRIGPGKAQRQAAAVAPAPTSQPEKQL